VSRAAVLEARGTFSLVDQDAPPPGDHHVAIRVHRTGICGTDLALWSGSYPVPLPLVPGHEFVGTVEAVGPGVEGLAVGTRVVSEINASCEAKRDPDPCDACRAGLERHCSRRTVVGILAHGGGFAERVVVPEGCVHPVPDRVDDVRAAFAEPVAAALQTFEMVGDPAGQRVLVLGPGRLGALIVAVARDLGATVGAVARSERSRQRARQFGAHAVFEAGDHDAIRAWAGIGADIVVEVTGQASSIGEALELVRPRGTVAIKSTPGVPTEVDLTRVVVDEVRLVGSRCGPFDRALDWLAETTWPVAEMVEATFPLSEIDAAFEAASRLAKVVVLTREP
jgi:threonine dehydrogenase-like Zn-dependent dehydrogenase